MAVKSAHTIYNLVQPSQCCPLVCRTG